MYLFFKGQYESGGGTGDSQNNLENSDFLSSKRYCLWRSYEQLQLWSPLIPTVEHYRGQELLAVSSICFGG